MRGQKKSSGNIDIFTVTSISFYQSSIKYGMKVTFLNETDKCIDETIDRV